MDLFFGLFYVTRQVLHQKPGWPTYSTPDGTQVLTPGCSISGFRGEASGSPSLARSDLVVPNQGPRRGAFAARHKPLDRRSFQRIGDN
jgi:hypothetical protein